MTSRISCVDCSGASSSVDVGVGRARDGAGETGWAGETGRASGGVGDEQPDSGGGSVHVKRTGCPLRA